MNGAKRAACAPRYGRGASLCQNSRRRNGDSSVACVTVPPCPKSISHFEMKCQVSVKGAGSRRRRRRRKSADGSSNKIVSSSSSSSSPQPPRHFIETWWEGGRESRDVRSRTRQTEWGRIGNKYTKCHCLFCLVVFKNYFSIHVVAMCEGFPIYPTCTNGMQVNYGFSSLARPYPLN